MSFANDHRVGRELGVKIYRRAFLVLPFLPRASNNISSCCAGKAFCSQENALGVDQKCVSAFIRAGGARACPSLLFYFPFGFRLRPFPVLRGQSSVRYFWVANLGEGLSCRSTDRLFSSLSLSFLFSSGAARSVPLFNPFPFVATVDVSSLILHFPPQSLSRCLELKIF